MYTNFATLDAVSNGRAQLVVGRGSLTESFPLFGFDLADYEELFEEKLDLLTRLLRDQPVTWSGKFKRKNVGDNPGDSENDKTAVDTITGVYQSGLDNLKKLAEAQ